MSLFVIRSYHPFGRTHSLLCCLLTWLVFCIISLFICLDVGDLFSGVQTSCSNRSQLLSIRVSIVGIFHKLFSWIFTFKCNNNFLQILIYYHFLNKQTFVLCIKWSLYLSRCASVVNLHINTLFPCCEVKSNFFMMIPWPLILFCACFPFYFVCVCDFKDLVRVDFFLFQIVRCMYDP